MNNLLVLLRETLVVFFVLFCAQQLHADCEFDEFPVMDGMDISSIGGDAMVWNGRSYLINAFMTDSSVESVTQYYHRRWEDRVDDSYMAPWNQITTVTDDCLMMVQIAAKDFGGGSYGRLVVGNPPRVDAKSVGESVLRPMSAIVVSDMKSEDANKDGRLTMLSASEGVDEVAQFYIRELQKKKWTFDSSWKEGSSRVLQFRKNGDEYNVLLSPTQQGFTQILINQVEI